MKRIVAVWLAAALCVALVGGAVLAEGQDDMPVELELDAPALSDAPETDDAGMDLDLDIAPLDGLQPEPVEAPVSNDPGDGEDVSNKIVVKKYITYEIVGGQATAITADRSLTEANIMDEVNGYPVTAIAPNAFQGFTKLWTVTVPDSVTEIGEAAFDSCTALVSVTLPESLETIGPRAFANCTKLSHFELPEGLSEISEGMFENCQMMWKITLPSTLRVIGENAFNKCLSLKEFTLPQGLREIHESAFELCESMIRVTIPGSVAEIGDKAFKDCRALRNLTLSSGLTTIGNSAFRDCDSFRKVALPSTVEEIGPFAFAYCEDLKTVTIPGNVETVSYGAFFHCGDLEQVSLKSGVAAIGDFAFAQCKKLLKAEIPQSVTEMGQDVFTVGKASAIDENDMVQLSAPLSQPAKLQIYGRPDTEASDYADRYGIPFVIQKIVATSVTIAEGKSATLYVGHPMQLTAIQKPANAETKVKWTSSSSAVSVSSSGLVTPKRAGKAVITARTENGKKATITIKVIDAKSVKIDQGKSATLKVGQTLQLTATVSPAQVTSKLTWSSGSKKIATVSSTGLVKALKKGNVTITVKTGNGKKAKIKIKVTN